MVYGDFGQILLVFAKILGRKNFQKIYWKPVISFTLIFWSSNQNCDNGPNARELLASVTRSDVSGAAFKFMDVKRMTVGEFFFVEM